MPRNFYLICKPNRFKANASLIGAIIGETMRFYPDRAFCDSYSFYYSPGHDGMYQLEMEGAIILDSIAPALSITNRLPKVYSIEHFLSHCHLQPAVLLGFVFNPALDAVFLWEGNDNFMPLLGNNFLPFSVHHPKLSAIMNAVIPEPMQELALEWLVYSIYPAIEGRWFNKPVYIMYATTEARAIPGALALPIEYYEDMPETEFPWADEVAILGLITTTKYKDAQTLLNNQPDEV